MREKLKRLHGKRTRFRGIFVKYGEKAQYKGKPKRTVLLQTVQTKRGETVTTHAWFTSGKQFDELGELKEGDIIEFDARVTTYIKGYVNESRGIDNRQVDYRLSNPTKLKLIKKVVTGQNKLSNF